MNSRQGGAGGLLIAVLILLLAVIALAAIRLSATTSTADRSQQTAAKLALIGNALDHFASTSERLPCPADPSANSGDAVPATASATCTFAATGTVPWRAIGIRQDDAFDSWGDKISYRVFSGTSGLTQANGASMVNCRKAPGVAPTPSSLAPGDLCGLSHDHTAAQFLVPPLPPPPNAKGLSVNDFGTNRADIAYVLVSHGPTGLGAYTSAGVRKTLPTSANELANINTSTPAGQFVAQAASAAGSDPNAATFFDDVIAFQSIPELVTRANLAARDWPENFLLGYTMDSVTVSAAAGGPVSPGALNTDTLSFGTGASLATVRSFDSGGNQNLTFNTTGGAPSLGVEGNGSNLMSSTGGEFLRLDFAQKGWKLGVALAGFGTYVVSGTTYTERVEFRFSGGTTSVNIIKSGCNPDSGVATFSIDPGTDFNRVEIHPLAATPSGATITGLAEFRLCGASGVTCLPSLATSSNRCP
jgi:type II secretory pathway pseudopilin PulG